MKLFAATENRPLPKCYDLDLQNKFYFWYWMRKKGDKKNKEGIMLKILCFHLEENASDELSELVHIIKNKVPESRKLDTLTRADLIRFALSRVYGLSYPETHVSKENLWNIIRNVKKDLPDNQS